MSRAWKGYEVANAELYQDGHTTEAKSTFELMKIDLQQSKYNGTEVKIDIATSSLLANIKVSESCKC